MEHIKPGLDALIKKLDAKRQRVQREEFMKWISHPNPDLEPNQMVQDYLKRVVVGAWQ
jgi:hypothetical protein